MIHSLLSLIDPMVIVQTAGLIGVIAVVFAETGLFFGFFLPGDSLLFTAGLLASRGFLGGGDLGIVWLILGCTIAAIVGDAVGYYSGKKAGPALFNKEDSLFFNKKHIIRAQKFYEQHGKKTIIMARFIPIIRTFAPIVAGIGNMNYRTFLSYNIVGGIAWVWSMSLLGYFLGSAIPSIDKYILPIIIGIIAVSFIPAIIHVLKERRL
ncbi:MAG: VTT domain-containing protein [Patescibacteria group bacterium]